MAPDTPRRTVAGRYRLDRLIGRGGSGAVWRGLDQRLDRAVAIKVIAFPAGAEGASIGRSRVLREARAAARVAGPGVVSVYDIVEEDGGAYLVMELVEAPNLNVLVRRAGPLTPPAAAILGLRILDTLVAAHDAGIIHRDVKPSNVLVDGDQPRLTDFGIARLVDDTSVTVTGVVMGTPAYVAPEHASGEAVGPPTDLYGLGATMYYAVEGVPPFKAGGSLATVMAVLNEPPRAPQRAGRLTAILDDLLSKDPTQRPDADALRPRLQAVVASASTAAVSDATSGVVGLDAAGDGDDPAADDLDHSDDTDEVARAATMLDDTDVVTTEVPVSSSRRERGQVHQPASASTHQATRPSRRDRGRGTVAPGGLQNRSAARRRAPALLAIMAALLLAGAVAVQRVGGQPESETAAAPATAAPDDGEQAAVAGDGDGGAVDGQTPTSTRTPTTDADEGDAGATAGDPADEDEATPSEADDPSDGVLPPYDDVDVPDDWVEFEPDGLPYSVSHPPGWRIVQRSSTLTELRDPETGRYLRLDWVAAKRNPVRAWENVEAAFSARFPGSYRRLQITPTSYEEDRAALWEYRYSDGGADLHAFNLGVNRGQNGFALNLQSRQSLFAETRELWPYFLASFEFDAD